jgi:hypothetical protein
VVVVVVVVVFCSERRHDGSGTDADVPLPPEVRVQANGRVPEDFTAFVATHAGPLAGACHELTGDHRLATTLQRDLLAAVALRWWWLRLRNSRRAAAHLRRLVRREAGVWLGGAPDQLPGSTRAALAGAEMGGMAPIDSGPAGTGRAISSAADRLADDAWERAATIRRNRRIAAVAAAFLGACLLTTGPRAPRAAEPDDFPPEPTEIPAGVLVLPIFSELHKLPARTIRLPSQIDVSPDAARRLETEPIPRAVAVARQELGTLLVVAEDGSTRRVDDATLAGARLLTTSLSPDGERVAMVSSNGLLVIEVDTGQVRSLGAGVVRPGTPSLIWRSARSVLVPAVEGAREIDVDTGSVLERAGVTGLDVVSTRGPTSTGFTEMLGRSTTGLPPRIRVWRTEPGPSAEPPPTPGVAPESDIEDRRVSGPPWVGTWMGTGWATGDTFVRACLARFLDLPRSVGSARAAIAAISGTGLHAGTLTVVDFTTLDILGFADAQTVLVSAGSSQMATTILAWNPRTAVLQRVTTLNGYVRVSLADLLTTT